jgi:hypothetical protein
MTSIQMVENEDFRKMKTKKWSLFELKDYWLPFNLKILNWVLETFS